MVDMALRTTQRESIPDDAARDRAIEGLAGELAWCLGRFVNATADEASLERALRALIAWRAIVDRP
jgi:hypothetical protein